MTRCRRLTSLEASLVRCFAFFIKYRRKYRGAMFFKNIAQIIASLSTQYASHDYSLWQCLIVQRGISYVIYPEPMEILGKFWKCWKILGKISNCNFQSRRQIMTARGVYWNDMIQTSSQKYTCFIIFFPFFPNHDLDRKRKCSPIWFCTPLSRSRPRIYNFTDICIFCIVARVRQSWSPKAGIVWGPIMPFGHLQRRNDYDHHY